MLKILGRLSSINVRKVVWTCAELGLAYDREDWGAGFRDPNTPEFLALNPNAFVPVIEDEGFVLWESSAIMRHLARRHGGGRLMGEGYQGQALVDQWLSWQGTDLNGAWGYAVMALVRRQPGYDNPAQIARSAALWGEKMAILDGQLGRTGAYVAGEALTLADIAIGLSVKRWNETPIEKPALQNVDAYFARLQKETEAARHGIFDFP